MENNNNDDLMHTLVYNKNNGIDTLVLANINEPIYEEINKYQIYIFDPIKNYKINLK